MTGGGIYINLVKWFDISQRAKLYLGGPTGQLRVGLGAGVFPLPIFGEKLIEEIELGQFGNIFLAYVKQLIVFTFCCVDA